MYSSSCGNKIRTFVKNLLFADLMSNETIYYYIPVSNFKL